MVLDGKELPKVEMLQVDFGRLIGKNMSDKMYKFEFVEDLVLSVNGMAFAKVDAGMNLVIKDKVKGVEEKIFGINDRETINWRVRSLRVENLDHVADFFTTFIRSPLIEQFLKLNIVEDEAVLL